VKTEFDSPVLEMPVQEGRIIQAYFEDESGNKTEIAKPSQKVILIIETKYLTGKKANIDLSDSQFDYEYNGKILENDILNDFEITSDTMRIELKTVYGGKTGCRE